MDDIINALPKDGRIVRLNALARELGIAYDETKGLQEALAALIEDGIVEKIAGRYGLAHRRATPEKTKVEVLFRFKGQDRREVFGTEDTPQAWSALGVTQDRQVVDLRGVPVVYMVGKRGTADRAANLANGQEARGRKPMAINCLERGLAIRMLKVVGLVPSADLAQFQKRYGCRLKIAAGRSVMSRLKHGWETKGVPYHFRTTDLTPAHAKAAVKTALTLIVAGTPPPFAGVVLWRQRYNNGSGEGVIVPPGWQSQ